MFPTKQDTDGSRVPLVSFTGRAPHVSKYLELTRETKKGSRRWIFPPAGPLDFQLLRLCPKAGTAILSEDRQSLNL